MRKRSVNSFNQVHELNQEYGVLHSNMIFLNKKDELMAMVCNLEPKIIALIEIVAKKNKTTTNKQNNNNNNKQKECNKSEYSISGYDLFLNNPKLGTAIFIDSNSIKRS